MKLGIGAVGLPAGSDFRKAGTARYAFQIIANMALLAPDWSFHVYVRHDFPCPDEWRLPNIILEPVSKYRLHWALGGIKARMEGYDAWFAPVYEVNRASWVPQIAMIHDLFPLTNPEWFSEPDLSRARVAIDRSCRKAKLLLANSVDTKERILAQYGGRPDRIIVTPLGPGNVSDPVRREDVTPGELERIGLPSGPFVFTLGTLEPRKNIPNLIEAFALLRPTHPDLHLAIGGGKGWREGPIFERVQELGLQDSVSFLGYVSDADLPALFACCEGFVMPSLAEGFGIPVLEAMHYGAPVACSDLGALREVGGDLAVYFDPHQPEAIAEGIASLIGKDREPLVAQGFDRAKHFTWQKTAERTLEAIRTFLAR